MWNRPQTPPTGLSDVRRPFPLPALLCTLGLSFAVRAWLFWLQSGAAIMFPDSGDYVDLARGLAHMSLVGDNGARTPGYSLILAALGLNTSAVVLLQMLMGLAVVLALFVAAWRMTGNTAVACAASLLYGLSLAQIFFEMTVLTEATTTAFLVFSLSASACALMLRERTGRSPDLLALLACATAGYCALTRPAFLFLPVLIAIFVLPLVGRRLATWVLGLTLLFLPIVGWSALNYSRFQSFTPTTYTGFILLSHTQTFFEYVPDEFAAIRDPFLAERTRLAEQGLPIDNLVYDILPQVMTSTGMSVPEVSRAYARASIAAIREQPIAYARSVASSLADFWRGLGRTADWSAIRGPILETAWRAQKYLSVLLNILFVASVAAVALVRPVRDDLRTALWRRAWLLLTLSVLCADVLQALAEHGDGARYGVPLQPISWLSVLLLITLLGRPNPRAERSGAMADRD